MDLRVWAAGLATIAFATMLALSIRALIQVLRTATEITVELKPEMQLRLSSNGPKVIYLKGPRMTRTWGLRLCLTDAAGSVVTLQRILVPLTWSSVADVTVAFARCQVPSPGLYTLTAHEIPTTARPMFVRVGAPRTLAAVGLLIAVVLSACLSIGSLVLTILLGSAPPG